MVCYSELATEATSRGSRLGVFLTRHPGLHSLKIVFFLTSLNVLLLDFFKLLWFCICLKRFRNSKKKPFAHMGIPSFLFFVQQNPDHKMYR